MLIIFWLKIKSKFKDAINKERLKHKKEIELSIAKLNGIENALEKRVSMVKNKFYFSFIKYFLGYWKS